MGGQDISKLWLLYHRRDQLQGPNMEEQNEPVTSHQHRVQTLLLHGNPAGITITPNEQIQPKPEISPNSKIY